MNRWGFDNFSADKASAPGVAIRPSRARRWWPVGSKPSPVSEYLTITSPIDGRLTTIVVTHFSPREAYGPLTPSSAGIFEDTVDSARSKPYGHGDTPVDIYYFPPAPPSAASLEYNALLSQFAEARPGVSRNLATTRGPSATLPRSSERSTPHGR